MSTYLMKEHLLIGENTDAPKAVEAIKNRLLAFSASLMPRSLVRKCELVLRAGKEIHCFLGKLPTPQFYGLLQAMDRESDLEFIGLYEYDWEDWWEESKGADPYSLESLFLRTGDVQDLFYSMYVGEDGEPGEVAAFGQKNKRQFRGMVPWAELPVVPDQGRWFAPAVSVHGTRDQLQKIDIHALLPVCRRFGSLGGQQELYFEDHSFHFFLRGLELRNQQQIRTYFTLCRELKKVSAGLCQAYEELADLSAADPRMLILQPGPDEKETVKITVL